VQSGIGAQIWATDHTVTPAGHRGRANLKVWAAKFTTRHPNLVALEISSFKCGHDAPIYAVIEGIIEQSGTPYFCFKDLDENKPSRSIRIRVETIDYFLRRYREEVIRKRKAGQEIETRLALLEAELRSRKLEVLPAPELMESQA
jgi:predicted nucleotide-binding protein (sugar kinase/HSP70/actin superfamily)